MERGTLEERERGRGRRGKIEGLIRLCRRVKRRTKQEEVAVQEDETNTRTHSPPLFPVSWHCPEHREACWDQSW